MDKKIMSGRGVEFESLSKFLRLLVDMLHHPSGRISGEQVNMWILLLRDPQSASTKCNLLTPFVGKPLMCYMDHIVCMMGGLRGTSTSAVINNGH
jgi:hypothetical protein